MTRAYITYAGWKYWDWNKAGFGSCNMYCGFAHSSDTYFYQVAGMLGIDRLAYWAHQWGLARRPAFTCLARCPASSPPTSGRTRCSGRRLPRRGVPGGHRPGLQHGHADPAPQRLLRARQWRHPLPAAAGASRARSRRQGGQGLQARGHPQAAHRGAPPGHDAGRCARNVAVVRHTYNLVDLPVVMAGKSGTAEFGLRDSQGRLPFHWSWASRQRTRRSVPATPAASGAVRRTDWSWRSLPSRSTPGPGQRGDGDGEALPPDPLQPEGGSARSLNPPARQLLRRLIDDGHAAHSSLRASVA